MDCGIPYCHNGCPVNNQIPDWNDLVYHGDWQEALAQPALDQQFPGVHRPRLPGALRGVLHAQHRRQAGHHQDDRMRHRRPAAARKAGSSRSRRRTRPARRSPSIGSGPAGLACAQQLARAGHDVHVYEKNAKAGGLLRYGIPDFKMEKHHVDRRVAQMEAEGVTFHYNVHVGVERRRSTSSLERLRRRRARRRRREAARPADPGPRARRHPFRHGFPAAAEPPRQRRAARQRQADPRRAASTSSSSAAATPARTASAPRSARARSRSPSSRSCRSRRRRRTRC